MFLGVLKTPLQFIFVTYLSNKRIFSRQQTQDWGFRISVVVVGFFVLFCFFFFVFLAGLFKRKTERVSLFAQSLPILNIKQKTDLPSSSGYISSITLIATLVLAWAIIGGSIFPIPLLLHHIRTCIAL